MDKHTSTGVPAQSARLDSDCAPQSTDTNKRLRQHGYAWWRLSLWSGIHFGMWCRILANNRFRISFWRLPQALLVTLLSLMNTVLRCRRRQGSVRSHRRPDRDPVLIIGHWRTGTTHLHDLLSSDPRFSYPNLSMAFMPHYPPWFCRLLQPLVRVAGHGVRPMDNIVISERSPQEDEFSLLIQGSPSPYEFLMFPRERRHQTRLIADGYTDHELEVRKQVIAEHVDRVYRESPGDRVLLKSPVYTGQIDILLELFPDARFVHLVRNPYQLFPSTAWMMRALQFTQGFQVPNEEEVDQFVIENLQIMYEAFDRSSQAIPSNRLIDVHYEDLLKSPIETIAKIYHRLELEPFEKMRSNLEQRLTQLRHYTPNSHNITDTQCEQIENRWMFYFHRYQYALGARPSDRYDA
jgi:omega-hydroxy-beta-dihydromenaquinone-9 sulfotransferase